MPTVTEESLTYILKRMFPDFKAEGLSQICGLFLDLQLKADNNEISTKPLDLRGLIGALKTVHAGLSPRAALRMGIVNKSFDLFERDCGGYCDDTDSGRVDGCSVVLNADCWNDFSDML